MTTSHACTLTEIEDMLWNTTAKEIVRSVLVVRDMGTTAKIALEDAHMELVVIAWVMDRAVTILRIRRFDVDSFQKPVIQYYTATKVVLAQTASLGLSEFGVAALSEDSPASLVVGCAVSEGIAAEASSEVYFVAAESVNPRNSCAAFVGETHHPDGRWVFESIGCPC